jgi:peptidyl-prolyl cis-trans isomerase D
MLDSFRNNMRGIATVIVVFIGGIFALSGTGSLFVSGVGADTALVVNGEKVSALIVQQATRQQRNRILQANEGVDPTLLDDELLRPQVMKELIDRKVIAQTAQEQGMIISSNAVSELLVKTTAFQADGKFDQDQFQYSIRNLGYTTATFIEEVKEDLVIQQFIQGLSQSSFVTELEISTLAGFTEQARDYYYLTLPIAPIMDSVQPSAEDISAYYEINKTQYLSDARVVVDYIELNAAMLSDDVTVSSAQIEARFDEEFESADLSVSRHVAHILLESPDEDVLAQIQAALNAGQDFTA